MDDRIINKYEQALQYEIFVKEEYGFAKKEIQKAKCIFDIGGHVGFFSERCRSLNNNTEIHYFEPVQDFYKKAKENLGNDDKIIMNNYGIGTKTEKGNFLINNEKTMQSSKYSSFLNPKGTKIEVKFYEMKNYLIDKHIENIDIIKMDIEGMEIEVLPSRTNFERSKIQNFIAEIHTLNNNMKKNWKYILLELKNIFSNIEIFKSPYSQDIFLIRCKK